MDRFQFAKKHLKEPPDLWTDETKIHLYQSEEQSVKATRNCTRLTVPPPHL
uniref:Uncharacterized protein n=1 Tax=Anguilla anguilla TaxID=7936 RepID=A0A0E9VDH7_ANGAN